jgi:hypothetical protein
MSRNGVESKFVCVDHKIRLSILDEKAHLVPQIGNIFKRAILLFLFVGPAAAQQNNDISDGQIVAIIVQASRDAYYRTGHPCACPEDRARNGSLCGRRSAYSRPGGASPYCYLSDVSKAEIDLYRARLAH